MGVFDHSMIAGEEWEDWRVITASVIQKRFMTEHLTVKIE